MFENIYDSFEKSDCMAIGVARIFPRKVMMSKCQRLFLEGGGSTVVPIFAEKVGGGGTMPPFLAANLFDLKNSLFRNIFFSFLPKLQNFKIGSHIV